MMPVKQMNRSIVAHCSSHKLSSTSSANNNVSNVENVADKKSASADEHNQTVQHSASSAESCDHRDPVTLGGNHAWERESNTKRGVPAADKESSIHSNKKSITFPVNMERATTASSIINIEDKIQEAKLTQPPIGRTTAGTGTRQHTAGQQKESPTAIEIRGLNQSLSSPVRKVSSKCVLVRKPFIRINLKPANNTRLSRTTSSSKRSCCSTATITSKRHRRHGTTFHESSATVSPKRKSYRPETITSSKRSKVQDEAKHCDASQSKRSSIRVLAKPRIRINLKLANTRLYPTKSSSKRSRRTAEFSKRSRCHRSSKKSSKHTLYQQSAAISSKRKSQGPETISSKRSKVKHETPVASGNDSTSILKQYHDADLALIDNLYEDLGQLGSGSFGSVNKAQCRLTKKPVVLKWQLDGDRAQKEYDLMSRFQNDPNVVQSLGLLKGRYGWFIVTVDDGGHDLFTQVANEGAYTDSDCAKVLVQVLRAMGRMHASRVMHRDIKPENVLYCKNVEDPNANVKLIDYGLSCEIPEDSRIPDRAGTYGYMAPEVLSGIYGSQADMYSIGSLGYFLVKGKHMAEDETARDWSGLEPLTVHFIQRLTNADPSKRMNAAQALSHPWMAV